MKIDRIASWGVVPSLLLCLACAQGNGGHRLEARSGRVLDAAGGQAVARADVFQVYWQKGRVGEPPSANALRWVEAGDEGAFRFREAKQDDEGRSPHGDDALEYGFYHPSYGLVRSGTPRNSGSAELELTGRMLDEAGQRASRLQLCGSRPADAVLAGVASRHCHREERTR